MALSKAVQKALNDQINHEWQASYLYFGMSAFFEGQGLKGFAAWMRLQSKEEQDHVMKLYTYLYDRGSQVELSDIKAIHHKWKTPLDVFKDSLNHEMGVTRQINDMMELAIAEKDYATQNFLQWFISEQVEEEALFTDLVQRMTMIADNRAGLFMMDRELGQRSRQES